MAIDAIILNSRQAFLPVMEYMEDMPDAAFFKPPLDNYSPAQSFLQQTISTRSATAAYALPGQYSD